MKKRNRQSFGRLVRWQRVYEHNGTSKSGSEASAYWDWVSQRAPKSHSGEYVEFPEANPDVLADSGSYEDRRHELAESIEEATRTFSLREVTVFNLLLQGQTEREIGLKLNVSRSMVQKYRRSIKNKLVQQGIKSA